MSKHCSACHQLQHPGHIAQCVGKCFGGYQVCNYLLGHPEVKERQKAEKKHQKQLARQQKLKAANVKVQYLCGSVFLYLGVCRKAKKI